MSGQPITVVIDQGPEARDYQFFSTTSHTLIFIYFSENFALMLLNQRKFILLRKVVKTTSKYTVRISTLLIP